MNGMAMVCWHTFALFYFRAIFLRSAIGFSDSQAYRLGIVLFGSVAVIESLVIILLLRGRSRSGPTELAFHEKEEEPGKSEIDNQPCAGSAPIDLTDRKLAEQALVESEKRFRLMADSAPVLMWLTGPDRLCTDVNQGWLNFTGRTMQDQLGEGWTHSIHPDDLQTFLSIYKRAFEAREGFEVEHRLRRFDGEYRWVRNNAVPRFLGDSNFAGYIGCCIDITEERKAKAFLAEFGGRLILAQEEERARIARELHDDINQRLALLANGLERSSHSNGELSRTEEKKELHNLWQLTNELVTDVQHLSHKLHPAKLHYLGLAAALRDLCHEFSRQHSIEVECNARDVPVDLDESASLSLFRAAQESLHNVAKHSHAHHVKVELSRESGCVRLRVSDDGIGFDSNLLKNKGLGVVSMGERIKSAGGQFYIWSRASLGTQVECTVPATLKQPRPH